MGIILVPLYVGLQLCGGALLLSMKLVRRQIPSEAMVMQAHSSGFFFHDEAYILRVKSINFKYFNWLLMV
jgi:hypothetical protein